MDMVTTSIDIDSRRQALTISDYLANTSFGRRMDRILRYTTETYPETYQAILAEWI